MWNQAASPKHPTMDAQPTSSPHRPLEAKQAASIGKSLVIKGDVIGAEDLTVDGRVEGRIELRGHSLLIGPNANVHAELVARTITIMGAVTGNIVASDKVDVRKGGSVDGDIDAPTVAMADGAQLCGRIDTLSSAKDRRQPLSIAV
jgi:cytoskeletal protein CcmA (bactofilin family)